MSDREDDSQRVRPISPEGIRASPSRPAVVGVAAVVVAVVVAAFVFFAGSGGGSDPADPVTPSTLAASLPEMDTTEAPTTTGPPTPTSTTITAETEWLSDLLPDVDGVLVAAITSQSGVDLVRWSPGASRRSSPVPMLGGPVIGFDITGEQMAFLGPSARLDASTLYVGVVGGWAPATVGVSSFRWHATIPGRIG